jgi:hypothetical protein
MGSGVLYCTATQDIYQEFDMTTATISVYADRGYLTNLAAAAANFARALFAAAPATASVSHGIASQASRLRDRASLFALAREFDALSPSQAAELRSIAGRD